MCIQLVKIEIKSKCRYQGDNSIGCMFDGIYNTIINLAISCAYTVLNSAGCASRKDFLSLQQTIFTDSTSITAE